MVVVALMNNFGEVIVAVVVFYLGFVLGRRWERWRPAKPQPQAEGVS
jgi:hypothetical protein